MNSANYVLAYFVKDEKILLLYRANTGFANNCYGLAGGKIEPYESAQQAVIREMAEELDIIVRPQDSQLVHVMSFKGNTNGDHLVLVFAINSWQGALYNRESHKHDHLSWFWLSNLPDNLMLRHRQIIEYILQQQRYSQEGY